MPSPTLLSPRPHHQPVPLEPDQLAEALRIRDLSDPAAGPHALQAVLDLIVDAAATRWPTSIEIVRHHRIVPITDNYDRLGYPPAAAARDARHSRYVSDTCMLRAHTTAMVPDALRRLARAYWRDVTVVCPGLVHRRDAIDRLHTGTPHQVDLWRLVRGRRLGVDDLEELAIAVVRATLPDADVRLVPTRHPYTDEGRQIDARPTGSGDGGWVEVGECGLAGAGVLRLNGHDPRLVSGLAVGLGLDRLLMLRKGIPDIRLLRSQDPRVLAQMLDLDPWHAVSNQPAIVRDLSILQPDDVDDESLGDHVRDLLRGEADLVEEVSVQARTPAAELPASALTRLGLPDGRDPTGLANLLVRVVLRSVDRTLTDGEANALRDRLLAGLAPLP